MIILVDLSSVFYRNYHSCGNTQYAYELTLQSVIGCIGTGARVIVCCEGGKLLRSEWDPAYKANRPPKEPGVVESLHETIKELRGWEMITVLSCPGYEADDLIATIASRAREEVQVWSSDKDLYQLLSSTVSMIVGAKVIGPDDCVTKFGVRPDQLRDYLTICGDSSDNIKGCPGIGGKGAAALLQKFGTLDGARSATDDELGLGPKTLAKFRAWDPTLATKLVSLLYNAPIHLNEIFPTESTTTADMSKIVTERGKTPLKILAYGPEGAGKTRFGAFSPKPIFLCAEHGLSAPDLKSIPSFPAPDSWADVLSAVEWLKTSQHDHKTFVIDSLDWLHQHARAEVCRREGMSPSDYESFGRGEKLTFELWVALMGAIDGLQEKRNMHLVVLAHSAMETFQNPQGEDFTRYQLALTKRSADRWKQWPDFLLFLNQELFTKKNKDDKIATGIIGGHRIYTQRAAAFDAKNRINLPAEIEYETANPWRPFAAAVREIMQPPAPEVASVPQPKNADSAESAA